MPNQFSPLVLFGGVLLLAFVVVGVWLNRRPSIFKALHRAQPYWMLAMGTLFLILASMNASRPGSQSGILTVAAIGMLVFGLVGLIRWPRWWFPSADEAMARARRMGPYEAIGRVYVYLTLPCIALGGLFWLATGQTYMAWWMAGMGVAMAPLAGLLAWHRRRYSSRAIATSV
ncbi:MAG: hypothetical protein AAGK09_12000 [Planctomycetota bacterium]